MIQNITLNNKMVTKKDLWKLELFDVADGIKTTGFIFQDKKGKLIGFKVPTEKIEYCEFNIQE